MKERESFAFVLARRQRKNCLLKSLLEKHNLLAELNQTYHRQVERWAKA